MLAPGSRIGPFEVLSPLGAGGMGEVYRARDPRLERDIALKVLPADTLRDETARTRMVREARLAAQLNHPNICTVHEVGEAEGQVYIAMELVEGESLGTLLAAGALSTEQALSYGAQVADALAHAHSRGVVHRDLKSANVVVTPEGRAKVLDFGLAKRLAGEELAEATTQLGASLTAPGSLVGTLAYMAPEQINGRPADARSDIWALGVVLYEMLGGRRPFVASTGFALSSAILTEAPPPLPASVPATLRMVVERCLAKVPGERFQTAEAARTALEMARSGGVHPAPSRWTSELRRQRWPLAAAALVAIVMAGMALDVGGVRRVLTGGSVGREKVVRMAVLPFANLSGEKEQEYFSDGLTEEMIAQLGRVHPEGLSVIARSSVMRYKNGDTPIDEIGRDLKVDYVLEGSARREGDRVRVTAELIHVRDQTQLWADTYERELTGILALQSEVARQVARAMALTLLPGEQAQLASTRTVKPEAYEAFLRGNHSRQSFTADGYEAAERYYTLALEIDPTYAAAWAGLARVWTGRQQMGITPAREAGSKAKAAALKALGLDGTDWEAHRALAGILTWTDWDWPAAEGKWKQITKLDPNHPEALQGYSHFLMNLGRPGEAMPLIERALEVDPFSVRTQSFYATDLVYARRYDDAIAAARAAFRLEPDALVPRDPLYQALLLKGLRDEALALDKEWFADDPELIRALRQGEAEAGYAGAQRRLAEILSARSGKPGGVTAFALARRWLYAGDHDRALEWLEKAYEAHDAAMPYLGLPIYDSVRSDPRFQSLLRRMNLPQG